ncbi:MAG: hypothetical protein LCH86_09865 [Proteobacteria bacterium]|nr:hypothetical protein [Pseudomonadota bacterium]
MATKPECPYCGRTTGLRQVHDGCGSIPAEYTCEGCFTATDTGPCFDDLPLAPVTMTPREAGEAAFYECEGNNAACLKAAFDAYEAAAIAPLYKVVERILDEESAYISRPSRKVTQRIALAAAIAGVQVNKATEDEYPKLLEDELDRARKWIEAFEANLGLRDATVINGSPIAEFVAGYQFDASDEGFVHTPTFHEQTMIEDAICSFISDGRLLNAALDFQWPTPSQTSEA